VAPEMQGSGNKCRAGHALALPGGTLDFHAKRDYDMSSETAPRQVPPQRGGDRRRDFGRRITRDRRRDTIAVQVERRSGTDRRSGGQRRARADRRTRPSGGFRFLDG